MAAATLEQILQQAREHRLAGRYVEAEAACNQALAQQPEHPLALHYLGLVAHQRGQDGRALEFLRRSVAASPATAAFHANLAEIARKAGQWDEAHQAYRKAIELGMDGPDLRCGLGFVLHELGASDDAIACYRQAIARQPHRAQAWHNLGATLAALYRFDEAAAAFGKAIDLDPSMEDAWYGLVNVALHQGDSTRALAVCERALQRNPHSAEMHWLKATLLLLLGRFEQGWNEHEWRRKRARAVTHEFPTPPWNGSGSLADKTILLHAEQGFGDAIQFVRYASVLAQRGATVMVECQRELASLFRYAQGVWQVFPRGQALPPFDLHCPLMSVPAALRTTLDTVPAQVPYLSPPVRLVEAWHAKLPTDAARLRVGLVWAGNPKHQNDRERSLRLSALAPLAQVPGVTFFSLQKGAAAEQAANPPAGMTLVDLTARVHEFLDTAALLANLDLLISVDTAVAHLAGAMGKPTWVLLPFVPDWRWMLDRADTPWYPTLRLFRQSAPGDWSGAIARVAAELKLMVS